MLPGEKIRSLTFADARNIADSKAGAGIGALATVGLAGAEAGAFRTYSLLGLDSVISLSSDLSQAQVTKVMGLGTKGYANSPSEARLGVQYSASRRSVNVARKR